MAYLEFDQLCKGVARHDLLVLRIGPNLGDQDGEDLGLHLQVALEDVNGVAEDVAELIRSRLFSRNLMRWHSVKSSSIVNFWISSSGFARWERSRETGSEVEG
jgi:hypothetical protein